MAKTKSGIGPGSGRTKHSWQKNKRVSKNKVRQATCCYCQISDAARNYPRHLKLAHRVDWEENPRDLREFGDRALSFSTEPVMKELVLVEERGGGQRDHTRSVKQC